MPDNVGVNAAAGHPSTESRSSNASHEVFLADNGTAPSQGATRDDLRYELKILLGEHDLGLAEAWVRLHHEGFRLSRPPRRVNRLYFDTFDLDCLAAHLAGVPDRLKARLHWYGSDWGNVENAWLELKVKRSELGCKPRWPLDCTLDLTRPWSEIIPLVKRSLPKDVQVGLQSVTRPTVLAHYQRSVHATPDDAVKITIDSHQRAFDQRLGPRPNTHIALRIASPVVMEIKTARRHADRAWELVSSFPGRPYRYSKYVDWTLAAIESQ